MGAVTEPQGAQYHNQHYDRHRPHPQDQAYRAAGVGGATVGSGGRGSPNDSVVSGRDVGSASVFGDSGASGPGVLGVVGVGGTAGDARREGNATRNLSVPLVTAPLSSVGWVGGSDLGPSGPVLGAIRGVSGRGSGEADEGTRGAGAAGGRGGSPGNFSLANSGASGVQRLAAPPRAPAGLAGGRGKQTQEKTTLTGYGYLLPYPSPPYAELSQSRPSLPCPPIGVLPGNPMFIFDRSRGLITGVWRALDGWLEGCVAVEHLFDVEARLGEVLRGMGWREATVGGEEVRTMKEEEAGRLVDFFLGKERGGKDDAEGERG